VTQKREETPTSKSNDLVYNIIICKNQTHFKVVGMILFLCVCHLNGEKMLTFFHLGKDEFDSALHDAAVSLELQSVNLGSDLFTFKRLAGLFVRNCVCVLICNRCLYSLRL